MDVVFEFTRVVVSAVSKRCASAILEVARQNPRYTGKLIEMGQATNRVYVHLKYFSGRVLMPPGTPQYLRSNTGQHPQQVPQQNVQNEIQQLLQSASTARRDEETTGGGGAAAGGLEKYTTAGKGSFPLSLPFARAVPFAPSEASQDEAAVAAAPNAASGAREGIPTGDAGVKTPSGAGAGPAGSVEGGMPESTTTGAAGTTAEEEAGEKPPEPPPSSGTAGEGSYRVVRNGHSSGVCTPGGSDSSTSSGSPNTGTFARANSSSTGLPFMRSSSTISSQHTGSSTGGQRPPQAKITLSVKPLDEDKALEVGAEALSDGLVMIVMLCLVAIGLYIRRSYAARSEARVRQREEQLRLQYEATQEQLDRIVAFLQQQFPHAYNQSALLSSPMDAAKASALAAAIAVEGETSTGKTAPATTPPPPGGRRGSPATQSEAAAATSEGNVLRKREAATEKKAPAGG